MSQDEAKATGIVDEGKSTICHNEAKVCLTLIPHTHCIIASHSVVISKGKPYNCSDDFDRLVGSV